VKLLDLEETIVVVTGSTAAAIERDRPLAMWLRDEIDRRANGQTYRRAVLTDDESYFRSELLQRQTTIAIGGPGVNAVTQHFFSLLATVYAEEERVWVQANFDGEQKRAGLWGVDAAATSAAVDAFVVHGHLDELLTRIGQFWAVSYES
jgi:hypothetical protein